LRIDRGNLIEQFGAAADELRLHLLEDAVDLASLVRRNGAEALLQAIEQLLAEFERIRDLSGPAGMAQGDVFANAIATIERAARRD